MNRPTLVPVDIEDLALVLDHASAHGAEPQRLAAIARLAERLTEARAAQAEVARITAECQAVAELYIVPAKEVDQ